MPEVSLSDMAEFTAENQTLPSVPDNTSLDDIQKMGLSSDITYHPPQAPKNVFDRMLQDVEKPIASAPQALGAGMYWLGDHLASENSPSSFRKLGDRISAAGIAMKENNQKYVEENYNNFDPNILDDVVSGVPMVVGGGSLAALIGVPAAVGTLAVGVGGATAAEAYSVFRGKGGSRLKADALAGVLGAGMGSAMAFGMGKFLEGTGPWFKRALGATINNFIGGAVVGTTSDVLQTATGLKEFRGKESLVETITDAAHDGIVWGILGGATAVPLALAQHNAVVEGFKKAGLDEVKAREAAHTVMSQGADAAMAWVEKDLKMTPDQQSRIQIPQLEGRQSSGRNDLLDYDFVPKDLREAAPETGPLEEQIAQLKTVKEDISNLKETLKGNVTDLRAKKVLAEQTQQAEDKINDKFDALEKQQTIATQQMLKNLESQKEKISPEAYSSKKSEIQFMQNKAEDQLGHQRESELQTEMDNRPFIQDVKKELAQLQTQHEKISEKIKKSQGELKGPTKLEATKAELRKLSQGFRQGRSKTREEIKDVQSQIVDLVKDSDLEPEDKSKFLTTVKNIQTADQFYKKLPELQAKIKYIEEKNLEKQWGKDLQNVSSKILPKLPVDYQDALKPLLDSFDFSHRSAKTVLAKEGTRRFFENKLTENDEPLSDGEKRALDQATKKSLSELSHEDIRSIYETVMKVVTEGRRKNAYLTEMKEKTHEARVQRFLNDLNGEDFKQAIDNFDKNSIEQNKGFKQRVADIARRLDDGLTMPEFMLKWSQLPDLFQSLHEGFQNSYEFKQQTLRDLARIHSEVDFAKILGKPVEIPELDMVGDKAPRVNDIMRAYAQSFDEGGYRHLENTMSKEKIDKLLDWFEKNYPIEAKAIHKQFEEFNGKYYDLLDKVVVEMEGHHMNKVENYDPIGASLEDRSGQEQDRDMKLGSKGLRDRALPMSGFTKSRVQSKLAFRKFDYYGNLLRHLADASHYRAMAPALRDANKILYDPRVITALREKFGPDWVPMLHKWLKDVAFDGHQYDSYAAKIAATLRRNFVFAKLLGNVFSAGKVFGQMGPATTYVGGQWIGKAILDYGMEGKKWDSLIDSKSLQMKNRYFMQERELAETINSRGTDALWQNKLVKSHREIGMWMHQMADRQVTRITWIGEYRKQLALNEFNGGTEKEAVDAADRAVRLTHPMGGTLYLPDAFRGPEWQKMITTFLNVQNKNFNLLRDAHREFGLGESNIPKMIGTYLGLGLVPALWIAALSERRLPSPKEVGAETINQLLGSNLYLNFLTRALVAHRDVSVTVPWSAPFEDLYNVGAKKDKIRYGLSFVDDTMGLGTANIYRMVTGKMFTPSKEKK